MAGNVDREQRREAIAEAVWRLVADQGLEGVTMRHVAGEAGVSLGQVQHYFTSKDAMLRFALDRLGERVTARVGSGTEGLSRAADPHSWVRAVLVAMLPLDDQRRAEARVLSAFLARAAVAPALAAALRAGLGQLRDFLAEEVERGKRSGRVADRRDPWQEASTLLALLDGLTMHVLVGHHSPDDALRALDTHLNELFAA